MNNELNFDYFYNMEYSDLKNYLKFCSDDIKQMILSDIRIKDKLINSKDRHDFIGLAQETYDVIPLLLCGVGYDILSNTSYKTEKLNGIVTSGKSYVDELFYNEQFCEIIANDLDNIGYYLYSLSAKSGVNFVKHILNKKDGEDIVMNFIKNIPAASQVEIIKNYNFSYQTVNNLLKNYNMKKEFKEYVLKNTFYISSISSFNYKQLLNLCCDVNIPNYLLSEKKLVDKVSSIYDPRNYRFLMIELEKNNDISEIEKCRESFYNYQIENYDEQLKMIPILKEAYLNIINNKEISINDIVEKLNIQNSTLEYHFLENIYELRDDEDKLKSFFQNESNINISNMIIDCHFKDVYQNFLSDLRELVKFQSTEGKTLTDDDIKIYDKVLNIYNLSCDEKLQLHNFLKNNNNVEKFYDDYKSAKNKQIELINNSILNSERLKKYRDNELSEKYSVNISVLDGDLFYAFVKSTCTNKRYPLKKNEVFYNTDGSSYSLDGSYKLDTYKNPNEYYTFLYENIEASQVVHVYPVDSFSKYIREASYNATSRINKLLTPEELVKASRSYNEIIYSSKNEYRNDELNNNLKNPKILSIYCYDEITENDIITAKNLDIGITLIKTKKYTPYVSDDQLDMFSTIGLANNKEYNYDRDYMDDNLERRNKM